VGELGGLWADRVGGVLGEYPLLRVLRLAVSPDGDLLFYKRLKK
jgi:hypothetical protein